MGSLKDGHKRIRQWITFPTHWFIPDSGSPKGRWWAMSWKDKIKLQAGQHLWKEKLIWNDNNIRPLVNLFYTYDMQVRDYRYSMWLFKGRKQHNREKYSNWSETTLAGVKNKHSHSFFVRRVKRLLWIISKVKAALCQAYPGIHSRNWLEVFLLPSGRDATCTCL